VAIERKKLFKAAAWFVAVVVVLTLLLVFAQMMATNSKFLKEEGINVILMAVSAYIVYDIAKKYKNQKKKKQIAGIAFFSLLTLVYAYYFISKAIQ